MRSLLAQRLKKQRENEYRHRAELLEDIFGQAEAEMENLETLMADPGELVIMEVGQKVFEAYREDDETVYFEQGVIEL
jgi:hypothetical protein